MNNKNKLIKLNIAVELRKGFKKHWKLLEIYMDRTDICSLFGSLLPNQSILIDGKSTTVQALLLRDGRQFIITNSLKYVLSIFEK